VGYKHIRPAIMVEEFLQHEGRVPIDYKFYCFSGRVELLTLHFDRFGIHKTRSFDRDFAPHVFHYQFSAHDGVCERPVNFDEMVTVAEHLSSEFEFMRVDLYNIAGRIQFGEMTPYPGGVTTKFLPKSFDWELGKKWMRSRP